MKEKLSNFVFYDNSQVRVHPRHSGFKYSDGDSVEQEVLEILRNTQDVTCNSMELQGKISNWPTEYHFSKSRQNLIRHLQFRPESKVLELGAGCGALTRYLGELKLDITAIEGSLRRSLCARERCRDLSNVKIFCANFNEISFDCKYDVVTLIGVLEYSALFSSSPSPFSECLKMAYDLLNDEGTLIIAIENQLGLKYFAGISEDHIGQAYFGIENLYEVKGVKTVGKHELTNEVHKAGFTSIEWQFPFPDYKLPQFVCVESALDNDKFQPSEIIRWLPSRDYSDATRESFDLSMVWPLVARNKLIGDLSNSFLVSCFKTVNNIKTEPGLLGIYYASDRGNGYDTKTLFLRNESGKVEVQKDLISPGAEQIGAEFRFQPCREKYYRGGGLHSLIYYYAKIDDKAQFINGLKRWVNFLSQHSEVVGMHWGLPIPGRFIDCLPSNIVLSNEDLVFVDQEWVCSKPISIGVIVTRYLMRLVNEKHIHSFLQKSFGSNSYSQIRKLLILLDLVPRLDSYLEYQSIQNLINSTVYPFKDTFVDPSLENVLCGCQLREKEDACLSAYARCRHAFSLIKEAIQTLSR